jgi:hypothetical protein
VQYIIIPPNVYIFGADILANETGLVDEIESLTDGETNADSRFDRKLVIR